MVDDFCMDGDFADKVNAPPHYLLSKWSLEYQLQHSCLARV
jgi:hypothetical protein